MTHKLKTEIAKGGVVVSIKEPAMAILVSGFMVNSFIIISLLRCSSRTSNDRLTSIIFIETQEKKTKELILP